MLDKKNHQQNHTEQPEIIITNGFINYPNAESFMRQRIQDIYQGYKPELLWFLEHPPLLTLGTSAKKKDLMATSLPCYKSGRGGQITYHGPGQRVVYVMLDLSKRGKDVRHFVYQLESWILLALRRFNIQAVRRKNRVGLWIPRNNDKGRQPTDSKSLIDDKIAAIGVRVTKWITWHGLSINLNPDLKNYRNFIPCGIQDHGVTSLSQITTGITMKDLDQALIDTFHRVF